MVSSVKMTIGSFLLPRFLHLKGKIRSFMPLMRPHTIMCPSILLGSSLVMRAS